MTASPMLRAMRAIHFSIVLLLILFSPSLADEPWLMGQQTLGKRVVFLGESHASEIDHRGQLEALKALAARSEQPLLVVAEMFNESGRETLELSQSRPEFEDFEPEFWEQQWGHPYALYRPIFAWLKKGGHHLTDLRPDPERARQIKEKGIPSTLPLLGEFFLGPTAYRQKMAEVAFEHLPPEVPLTSDMVDKYFLVQCFWDEYMSWRIARLAEERPAQTVVVLVGHGHLHPEFGIPARLRRRKPDLSMLTVGFDRDNPWPADLWWDQSE